MAIALVAVAVYLPALANRFTNWDDPGYVLENPHLSPLDGRFLAWAFTTFRQANWHPLTWISLGFDHALTGKEPLAYHATNILLHGVATFLVVLLVRALFAKAEENREGRSLVGAAVAGLLFAVHPIHVESVAWISERKDLLCGLFYILSVFTYLGFAERRRRSRYLASLGAFLLALLSKPMAVSLPLVLLILDTYPLRRLNRSGWKPIVLEKVPFAILGAACSIVTMIAQSRGGAVVAMRQLAVSARIWNAEHSLSLYLAKLLLPINLVPFYQLEYDSSPWRPSFLLSLALILGLSTAAIVARRRIPLVGALWTAYLIMLLPVLGLVQVGQQAAADRYMYLPMVAPAIGAAALVTRLWPSRSRVRTVAAAAVLVVVAALSLLSIRQIAVWHDSSSLWRWVIAKQPNTGIAHYNLGEYLREQGDLEGAGRCWRRASELEPSFSWPLNQLGNLAMLHGRPNEARRYYEQAILVNPEDPEAQLNYAELLEDEGRAAEAHMHYEIFLRVAPPSLDNLVKEVRERLSSPTGR